MSRNGLSNASFEPLPNKAYPPLHAQVSRPEHTLIASEICARLIEWRSLHNSELPPTKWLLRLCHLAQDNPDALWLYLSLQTGDLSALTQTYQASASLKSSSREAIRQRHARALQDMHTHYPELSKAIKHFDSLFRPPRGIPSKKSTGPSQILSA